MNLIWDNLFKRNKTKDVRASLAESVLFNELNSREIRFIENMVHVRRYHAGEIIFKQNETGVGMYIIQKGRVEIFVTDEHASSPEFQNIFITQLLPGDFFGELSLVETNGRRTASAIAREETVLIGFFKPDLTEILSRSPSTGVKIVLRLSEVLGKRLKETNDKVSELRSVLKELRTPPAIDAHDPTKTP